MKARLLPFLLFACAPATAQQSAALAQPASYAVSANAYFPEDDEDYLQPTISADRGRLHVEARYNYEDRDTGSAWAGYNLSAGEELLLEFTPMLGVVAGRTTGVAPGYKGTVSWRSLALYSEAEYVFDVEDSSDSFLYTWSELTIAPTERWRVGIVAQRTKVYETGFDIQRGFLAGASFEWLDVTAYVLNPDDSPTFVLAAAASF
ncbi:MAG TPA: hypothetical protein VFR77_01195 [Steroidobacteraceae bacterium]|nr:hypothetical protein [Steroidobacteraceae bacterium]